MADNPRITREDWIAQSVYDYATDHLYTRRGYPQSAVRFVEGFPYDLKEAELTQNLIAVGFDFDDEGAQAEMGSDLITRVYTVQFWVFGMGDHQARNLAQALKFSLESERTLPLKNIEVAGAPVVDALEVEGASAERQIVPDPQPWQRFIWTATVQFRDYYSAGLQ